MHQRARSPTQRLRGATFVVHPGTFTAVLAGCRTVAPGCAWRCMCGLQEAACAHVGNVRALCASSCSLSLDECVFMMFFCAVISRERAVNEPLGGL